MRGCSREGLDHLLCEVCNRIGCITRTLSLWEHFGNQNNECRQVQVLSHVVVLIGGQIDWVLRSIGSR